jgi:hypothetical protein
MKVHPNREDRRGGGPLLARLALAILRLIVELYDHHDDLFW